MPCAESTATNSGSTPNSAKVLLVAYESGADGTVSLISLLTGQRRFSVGPGTGVRKCGPKLNSKSFVISLRQNVRFSTLITKEIHVTSRNRNQSAGLRSV